MIVSSQQNKKLNILLPNQNKVLDEVFKDVVKSNPKLLDTTLSLKSILDSLFRGSLDESAYSKTILDILKQNPTLKALSNITPTLKNIITLLEADSKQFPFSENINNIFTDIKKLDVETLRKSIQNSGIFFESKLLNAKDTGDIDVILSKDFKANILKTMDEVQNSSVSNKNEIVKNFEKLSLQIDYYQLLSHLSNSSCIYLPFSWDMLEDGNLEVKKLESEKFYCDINLKLKDFGEINLKLIMYEQNQLDLNIYTKSKEFKTIIKENVKMLRKSLIDVGVTPRKIYLSDKKDLKTDAYKEFVADVKMGFEVKV